MLRPYFILRLFVAALLPALTLPARAGDTVDAVPGKLDIHGIEQETFYLINEYRKANKLPPLDWNRDITTVSRVHSRDMATGKSDFGHDGFSERVAELKKLMPGVTGAGENVFKSDDPQDVAKFAVDVWLKSPPHRKNIRGDFNYSGLGIWVDKEGMIYFTQMFILTKPPVKQLEAPDKPMKPAEDENPLTRLFAPPAKTR